MNIDTLASERPFPPARLAIYYGWPSLVNGARGASEAAAHFGRYDRVVLGWGLQEKSHGDHAETAALIAALAGRTTVFGYIPMGSATGLSPRQVKKAAKLWRKLGVVGVLLDEAGYDYGNDRKRQNACYDAVHSQQLRVVANAWKPADLFSTYPTPSNPKGAPTALRPGDAVLYESYRIKDGSPESDEAWREKIQAFSPARGLGLEIWGIATGREFSPSMMQHLVHCAISDGLDAVGWGEPAFSAPDNSLPARAWPALPDATR